MPIKCSKFFFAKCVRPKSSDNNIYNGGLENDKLNKDSFIVKVEF